MYTGKGTRHTRVACGDASSWATPGLPKEHSRMGVIPEGCTNTLEGTWGSEACKQQPAASPAPCPAPCSWEPAPGELQPHRVSGTDTATASLKAHTACALQGCSARIRSHSARECGWAPRVRYEEQPGGRAGGSARPRPAAEGTEPPAAHPAPAGGTRGPHTSEGEECSVPEVKPSGGKTLRRGVGDFGGDLQFQQKSLRQCQLTSSPSPIWEP